MRQQASTRCGTKGSEPTEPSRTTLEIVGSSCVTAALMQGQAGGDPQFDRGRALFDKPFALVEGLGAPEMNADSCKACHQDPELGGAGALELNVSLFGNDNDGNGPFT